MASRVRSQTPRHAPRGMRMAWWLVTLLCVLLAALITDRGWLWRLDMQLYDIALTTGGQAPSEDIVIVAIDDHSLNKLGRWPWPRDRHADLINKLGEARAIALDIIFSEPSEPARDQRLADAMAAHGAVILPIFHAHYADGSDGLYLPALPLAEAAAALGHIHIELDPDGIARSVYLWEGTPTPSHPQLALAMLGLTHPELAVRHLPARSGGRQGWHRDIWTHIPFLGPPGSYRYISYADVLSGAVPAETFRDAIVFVGANAQGLGDRIATPTTGHAHLMPGVEVHATLYDALRADRAITLLPPRQAALLMAVLVFALMVTLSRLPARLGLLVTGLLLGLLLGATWLSLNQAGLWISPAGGLAALLLAYPLWSWRRLEVAQYYFDKELARLAPATPTRQGGGDHFGERVARLQALVEHQSSLRQSRDDTIHFLSHDLRSPLTAIQTLTALEGDTVNRDTLNKVSRYASSALEMVDNLREQARAENVDPLEFKPIALELLIEEAVDEVHARALARDIQIHTDFEEHSLDSPALVLGHWSLLRRALINILGNAVKYGRDHGWVRLRLIRDGGDWLIEVEDNGIGIADDKRDRLFRRLSRIDAEQHGQPGLGLGLLMVLTVMQRHGGQVDVRSEAGTGSCFSLRLPACDISQTDPA